MATSPTSARERRPPELRNAQMDTKKRPPTQEATSLPTRSSSPLRLRLRPPPFTDSVGSLPLSLPEVCHSRRTQSPCPPADPHRHPDAGGCSGPGRHWPVLRGRGGAPVPP